MFAINIDENKNRKDALGTFKLAKSLFLNRRKTIQNNLVNTLKDKELVAKLCLDLEINPLSRPEDLSPDTYLAMYKYLQK